MDIQDKGSEQGTDEDDEYYGEIEESWNEIYRNFEGKSPSNWKARLINVLR